MVSNGKLMAFINAIGGGSGAPADVVILPETEFPGGSAETQIPITTPLSATPTNGATAKVMYNGTEYPCTVVYAESNGVPGYVMGNPDALDMGLGGGNPDAPFVISLFPAGMGGMYGVIIPLEEVASITLSIVQKAETASAGGGVSRVVFENGTPVDVGKEGVLMAFNFTSNISGADILSAFNDGEYVFFDFINPLGDGSTIRMPIISAADNLISAGSIVNGVSLIALVDWDDAGTHATLEVYGPSNA